MISVTKADVVSINASSEDEEVGVTIGSDSTGTVLDGCIRIIDSVGSSKSVDKINVELQ